VDTTGTHRQRAAAEQLALIAQMLSDLDVGRSFSRPQVSNDNP